MNKEKTIEKVINAGHYRQKKQLLNEFRQFLDVMSEKYAMVILPEYVIAEECVTQTNLRKRKDVIKLVSEDKKEVF